ncbi:MAG: DegV family EDD domain-containing protein [Candidatus Heimdallarchaeota archaeon]|nr:DegV family EDD domain-containing protein [Candidatus Heimdallarchaeota archaeon]
MKNVSKLLEKKNQHSLLCPFCKEIITFELTTEEIEKRLQGGLAAIKLQSHGAPPHSLTIYLDKEGKIRGAYPEIEKVEQKINRQFNYIIDASCEISPKEAEVLGIEVLPYHVVINGKERKAYNEEIFFADVFNLLNSNKKIGSDPVSVEAFLRSYQKLDKNKPTIVLTMSRKYSEGNNNALKAKKMIGKEEPTFAQNIRILNSKSVGPVLKFMLKTILEMDEKGQTLEEIIEYINLVSNKHRSYVYLDTLRYLRKSNRISGPAAFFGNLLGIKPIIIENLECQGDLHSVKNVRSKEEGMNEIIALIKKQFRGQELAGIVFQGTSEEEAQQFRELLKAELAINEKDFPIDFIGTAIGMHMGFECLGVALFPKK